MVLVINAFQCDHRTCRGTESPPHLPGEFVAGGTVCLCACHDKDAKLKEILTERDEAIREVERLKESLRKLDEDEKYDHQFAQDALDLEKAYEAEKRRTAAYREVAIAHADPDKYRCFETPSEVDAEAQKLLADSGGEKDFKSQQKGDSES